jgi:porphobilinogen deaminase
MQAIVTTPDGARRVRRAARGDAARPAELGRRLAEELTRGGAIEILNSLR